MTLAAVLVVCLASLFPAGMRASPVQDQGGAVASQAQTPPPAPAAASPSGQTQSSPNPPKPSPKPRQHRKKAAVPDCSTSTTTPNQPGAGNSANASNAGSTTKTAGNTNQQTATDAKSTAVKPCQPPIVVIKNGGSKEPTVQLKGDATAEQASQERSTTEQLTAATEENLKKIAERQLSSSQQDVVNQIKDFLEQAKKAIAAGDLERGRNLAMKARLLSDELLKP
ncbi:MAG: hypothetical protein ABR880_14285 [Candidatus Sulfotelmatobacter sp.]